MADFREALKRVQIAEGGYVNDPDDKGGETYKGISRRAHADSLLWTYIEEYKKRHIDINLLDNDAKVQETVRQIYKNDYWDVFELDHCKSQKIAEEIFDDAVNRGVGPASLLASTTLGMTPVNKPTDELIYNLKHFK